MKTPCSALVFFWVFITFVFLGGAFGEERDSPEPPAPIVVEAVFPELATWQGPRFVQADTAGRIFVLDGESLIVYSARKGRLEEETIFQPATFGDPPFIRAAAMDSSGDRWFLLDKQVGRLFEAGKEKILPELLWFGSAVGFAGDTPLVAVEPMMFQNSAMPIDLDDPPSPPLVVALDEGRWKEYSDRSNWRTMDQDGPINQVIADSELLFAADPKRKVWLASRYAYRFRLFSPSGRQIFELALDVGASGETGAPPTGEGSVSFSGKTHVQSIACDRTGTMYAVVSPLVTGAGISGIDRYDGVTGKVERILIDLPFSHRLSAGAGKDGLYLMSFSVSGGAWMIPWEKLNEGKWEEVQGVRSGTRLEH